MSENKITVSNGSDKLIEAASNVLLIQAQLIEAYKELEKVATTDKLKSDCLSFASGEYTRKSLLVYALEKNGLTLLANNE